MCFPLQVKPLPVKIKPTSTRVISAQGLLTILRRKFPDSGEIYLSDHNYLMCNKSDIELFLKQDATNQCEYQAEIFDCDDFSYRLMGQFSVPDWSDLTFGIVWSNFHALNCIVTDDEKFYFIEPQSDEIIEELEDWMGSTVRFIMM